MNIPALYNRLLSYLREFSHPNPARDWFILISVALVILIGVTIQSALTFNTAARGGVIGGTTASSTPTFNRSSIDAVRTIFANRAAEEAKYTSGVYHYTDPSL